MADLVITAANVKAKGKTISTQLVQVGEAVTAGQGVYRKSSDSKHWLASNDVDEASATATGVALTGAATDGYIQMVTSGPMDVGATLSAGETYILTATAGGIAAIADLASTNYLTYLGYASDASTLQVWLKATGVQDA